MSLSDKIMNNNFGKLLIVILFDLWLGKLS